MSDTTPAAAPAAAPVTVEVRCPVGPQRLFTKLRLGQTTARYIQPDNHIEFACGDCARTVRQATGEPAQVLHRFNFAGELVQTLVQRRPAPPSG